MCNRLYKKKIALRVISLTMALLFLNELFAPSVVLALTSGPTMPEVYGYQPPEATDNVNLSTGQFNYTIPITSIPEYPMAIGYSSGMGMSGEASSFGFGFNGNAGAIARTPQGLPDDLDGGTKDYVFSNQKNIDISFSRGITIGANINNFIQAGVNYTETVGYNTYSGLYGAISLGAGLGAKTGTSGAAPDIGIGLGLYNDSRYGMAAFAGAQVGLGPLNGRASLFNATIAYTDMGKSFSKVGSDITERFNPGIKSFSTQTSSAASMLAPLANVAAITSYRTYGLDITIPIEGILVNAGAKYKKMDFGNETVNKTAYGFMYLNKYDYSQNSHLADMTVEGDLPYNAEHRNNPSYLQRDYFIVNTQGLNGAMQLNQDNYGLVCRNYSKFSDLQISLGSLVPFTMERKEVKPWYNIEKATVNKQVDIIALLKSDNPETDFDNIIFKQTEIRRYDNKFKSNGAKFKMRGDLAGEFNLASFDYTDHQPNTFDLKIVSDANVPEDYFFLGQEKVMPMYGVEPKNETKNKFNNPNHRIKRSTHIKHYTIGEMRSPTVTADLTKESFYNHYEYAHPANSNKYTVTRLNDNLTSFNLLQRLNALPNNTSVNNMIGAIEVSKADGLRYFFNLPVFNFNTSSLYIGGKGELPPVVNGTDYNSFSGTDRRKLKEQNNFSYPYAWLLTAIVGPDYIDFDQIPGPSDGDLGFWVKFRYAKAASNYRWRVPFTGLDHLPGAIHRVNDDIYTMTQGSKEVYYLAEAESRGHISKYTYHKRLDGGDAGGAGYYNGNAENTLKKTETITADPTGNNFLFAATSIDLYRKFNSGDNSATRDMEASTSTPKYLNPIRSTRFEYDYSICEGIPNNLAKYYSVTKGSVPYHVNSANSGASISKGKLTLRKVQHISYGKTGNPVPLPPYNLSYSFDNSTDPDLNPNYDPKQVDQWGNFVKGSKDTKTIDVNGVNLYANYTETHITNANKNAGAFALSKVDLPGGGSLSVDFEAGDYRFVQDRNAFTMRRLKSITNINAVEYTPLLLSTNPIIINPSFNHQCTLNVDISDLIAEGSNLNSVLSLNGETYAELAFYQNTKAGENKENDVFVSNGPARVVKFLPVNTNTQTQQVVLQHVEKPDELVPYRSQCEVFMYEESNKMRQIKEKGCNPTLFASLLQNYETEESAGPLDALNSLFANAVNFFKPSSVLKDQFDNCFGVPCTKVYEFQSFIRTLVYKGKYTGTRVKSLTFRDTFHYGTESDGTVNDATLTGEGLYRTNYFYDENEDGTGKSTGVATIEPGGGDAAAVDIYQTRGAGFYPSPRMMYAKTTVQTGYGQTTGTVVSRNKGKTVYEFFSPKDRGYSVQENFQQTGTENAPGIASGRFFLFGIWTMMLIKIRLPFGIRLEIPIPLFLPVIVRWARTDHYHLKSYSYTDYTDMYGRAKSIVQKAADGKQVSRQDFNYYGKDEKVQVYKGSPQVSDPFSVQLPSSRPGKTDQAWSESYYTKESDLSLMALGFTPPPFLNANTERNFCYTNMKYSYIPPMLKNVISTVDGLVTLTEYTGFDYYTGQPVEVRTNDSHKNVKIQHTIPAYWKYAEMGPIDENTPNSNMLTQATGSYLYLNSTATNNLLSVGITEWSKDAWNISDHLQASRVAVSANKYRYAFTKVPGSTIEQTGYNTPNSTGADNKIANRLHHFKPYKSYVFETNLDASTGTLSSFNDFKYPSGAGNDAKWKLISTNELFDEQGRVVQSKDVLNKYASAHFGYNFSNSVSVAGNAMLAATVYEGAENTYKTSPATNALMLEEDRVKLESAIVVSTECTPQVLNKTLNYTGFVSNNAHVLKVCKPSPMVFDKTFAKINVQYSNGVKRVLYASMSYPDQVKIISNRGEVFDGFFKFSDNTMPGCFKLVFDPGVLTTFALDAAYPSNGFTVNYISEKLPQCPTASKTYTIPSGDCVTEVHTGTHGFLLEGGGVKGTKAVITRSELTAGTNDDEFERTYKAMVWVHNTSPLNTKLIMELQNASGTVLVSKTAILSAPYVKTGNWKLLRAELDKSDLTNTSADKIVVYVKNDSESGTALYDDLRVLPYHAAMENFVYDPRFNRLSEKLNNEHFATYYRYDGRGRMAQVKAEIENTGKEIVKKYEYNDQKSN